MLLKCTISFKATIYSITLLLSSILIAVRVFVIRTKCLKKNIPHCLTLMWRVTSVSIVKFYDHKFFNPTKARHFVGTSRGLYSSTLTVLSLCVWCWNKSVLLLLMRPFTRPMAWLSSTAVFRCLAQEGKQRERGNRHIKHIWCILMFTVYSRFMAPLQKRLCDPTNNIADVWDTSGTYPYNHKERISAVKDTLCPTKKGLLLGRTRCSPKVVCDGITLLQGHWIVHTWAQMPVWKIC